MDTDEKTATVPIEPSVKLRTALQVLHSLGVWAYTIRECDHRWVIHLPGQIIEEKDFPEDVQERAGRFLSRTVA